MEKQMQKEKIRQKQKGITLIALIITIIVMLILVGVSVTVALKGELFSTAKQASAQTQEERDKELALDEEKVEVNEKLYNSIDEYVNGSSEEAKVTILPKKETYTVGEEVTIGNEHFFVIEDDAEKVTLLAKYNLNQEGTAQLNSTFTETACAFSSTNYWSDTDESYPIDLNDLDKYPIPEGETSIIKIAEEYGTTIGIQDSIGRLMRQDEAETLLTNHEGIIYGTSINATDGYLYFWLGSASSATFVSMVSGMASNVASLNFGLNRVYGVRPVLEISKSAI